jgi:hypothetical protein
MDDDLQFVSALFDQKISSSSSPNFDLESPFQRSAKFLMRPENLPNRGF